MNTQTEEEIERTHKALEEAIKDFKPNPRRVVFYHLKPFHDKIVEWRSMQASYNTIARFLKGAGVKTSRARVAEYGRVVLDGRKPRRRKPARRF
jgi:hypothetical protein